MRKASAPRRPKHRRRIPSPVGAAPGTALQPPDSWFDGWHTYEPPPADWQPKLLGQLVLSPGSHEAVQKLLLPRVAQIPLPQSSELVQLEPIDPGDGPLESLGAQLPSGWQAIPGPHGF